jgi:Xaa-Pro aminopeptidase
MMSRGFGMTTVSTDLSVYADRLRRAQAELVRQGIDFLLIGPSSDLFYLTGFVAHVSERLNLLILPKEGDPALILPVLEAPNARDRAGLLAIHAWEETESPSELAAKLMGPVEGKTLAVGDQLWSVFLLRLQKAISGANWIPALDVMRSLRMQKDAKEVEIMAEVSRRTDEAWAEFIEGGPISGLTETEAMTRLQELMEKRGLTGGFGICASGPNSASPHYHTGDRVIQQGDVVIFDWGATLEGYNSDITRTVYIGEPTEEFRQVYDIVLKANQATLEAVKPGVACEELDAVARGIITEAGYGPQFLHRVGHGLGLDVHEEPYLVNGNKTPLAVGMVFSDEPGIYLDGKFGIRIEDAVVCTEDGGKRLNEASRAITVMD